MSYDYNERHRARREYLNQQGRENADASELKDVAYQQGREVSADAEIKCRDNQQGRKRPGAAKREKPSVIKQVETSGRKRTAAPKWKERRSASLSTPERLTGRERAMAMSAQRRARRMGE